MYSSLSIDVNPEIYKSQIIDFLGHFHTAAILDSNVAMKGPVPVTGCEYDFIAAAGVTEELYLEKAGLDEMQGFLNRHAIEKNWVFGFLTYDVKNEIEQLHSLNPGHVSFPGIHLFVPQHIFIASGNSIKILTIESNPGDFWAQVISCIPKVSITEEVNITYIQSRESYLESVSNILAEIQYGNIYELNFCHEVRLHASAINGTGIYKSLNSISPNPFAAYYKLGELHLCCASPERFVKKKGDKIFSQPIKGTSPRFDDINSDMLSQEFLRSSEKESSENVMIVDLVRNDLSKVAQKSSVKVEELFGVYSFQKAHQMISTVSCVVKPQTTFTDLIRAAFPMGSMTGAPKVSAMQLIEKYENFRRGLFSGTVGYISPEGDFDFNVVIRSILCNEQTGNISVAAGGAITAASNAEKEYEETIIKIAPQLMALGLNVNHFISQNATLKHV